MLPQEIIRRKRDKQTLSSEQIKEFIQEIITEKVDDTQVAAFTMAVFLNGLNIQETIDLTLAMRDSGDVLQWQNFDKPIVDKHSSGGVGDKVSIMLAPILAACDVYVPMVAGRGLGHTGGTIDKLEAIPNYNTQADNSLFRNAIKKVGCAIIGQTKNLAPADKKIYAIRDVCATVESIPLITSSILSKKLASGLQYLIVDLKCGNGAFMHNITEAKTLAESIVEVANGAGTKTRALITDMNQVLGKTVGNALEIIEAIEYLRGEKCDTRLDIITRGLCVELLQMCGRCTDRISAEKMVESAIMSGQAAEKFAQMIAALGGPNDIIDNYNMYLPRAAYSKAVYAPKSGYISAMNTQNIGLSIIELGGGRITPNQKLDLATGYTEFVQIGDYVDEQTPLAIVHYQTEKQYMLAQQHLLSAIQLSETKPILANPIIDLIK